MSNMLTMEHVEAHEFYVKQSFFRRLLLRFTSIGCLFRIGFQRGWINAESIYRANSLQKAAGQNAPIDCNGAICGGKPCQCGSVRTSPDPGKE